MNRISAESGIMREASVDVTGEAQLAELEAEQVRLKPDGATDPVGEAGWYLAREREQRGETLDEAGAPPAFTPITSTPSNAAT